MPVVIFDPNITPGELAQAAVVLLRQMREVLGPATADCETSMRRINQAFELHDVFRQTLERIPENFVAVTRSSVIRRSNIAESGVQALNALKTYRRAVRERCRKHFKYESGLDA